MTTVHLPAQMESDYVDVSVLENDIAAASPLILKDHINRLADHLLASVHEKKSKSYFLYRKAAKTLAAVLLNLKDQKNPSFQKAHRLLKDTLRNASDKKRRAAAVALGGLPFQNYCLSDKIPHFPTETDIKKTPLPFLTPGKIASYFKVDITGPPAILGRTYVFPTSRKNMLLAVKIAQISDDLQALNSEAVWMRFAATSFDCKNTIFHIPIPMETGKQSNCHLFRAAQLGKYSSAGPKNTHLSKRKIAVAFMVHESYYRYPNDAKTLISVSDFMETAANVARLFGLLNAQGIVHTAPIPLFHNRIQRGRREDGGVYEWQLGGRLDRWTASCRHPNFGPSGLRDFEHFKAVGPGSGEIYRHIGNELLSLILVCGSWFRNHAPGDEDSCRSASRSCAGKDIKDLRRLFDSKIFMHLVETIFRSFHEGFTGAPFEETFPVDFSYLSMRLIEEMGVDRHMEEIFRARDQEQLSDEAFQSMLIQNGFTKKEAAQTAKGKNDITLFTGPHLGEFNGRISLPELIHYLEASAALSVSNRFIMHC